MSLYQIKVLTFAIDIYKLIHVVFIINYIRTNKMKMYLAQLKDFWNCHDIICLSDSPKKAFDSVYKSYNLASEQPLDIKRFKEHYGNIVTELTINKVEWL